jgi:hypothetical protein
MDSSPGEMGGIIKKGTPSNRFSNRDPARDVRVIRNNPFIRSQVQVCGSAAVCSAASWSIESDKLSLLNKFAECAKVNRVYLSGKA